MFTAGPTFFSPEQAGPPPFLEVVTPGTPGLLGSDAGTPVSLFFLSSTKSLLQYIDNSTGHYHIAVVTRSGSTATLGANVNLGTLDSFVVPVSATKAVVFDDLGVVEATPGYLRGYTVDLTTMATGTTYVLGDIPANTTPSAVALSSTKLFVLYPTGTTQSIVVDVAGSVLTSTGTFTEVDGDSGSLVQSLSSSAGTPILGYGYSVSGSAITESPTPASPPAFEGNWKVIQMDNAGAFAVFDFISGSLHATRGALSGSTITYGDRVEQVVDDTFGFGANEDVARISDSIIFRTCILPSEGNEVWGQTHGFFGDINPSDWGMESISAEGSTYPRSCRIDDSTALTVWQVVSTGRIGYSIIGFS